MTRVPVCIIGCGPIGLAASLLLSRFGIRTLIVEKRGELNTHPRSRFVDTNTMELMRFLGVEQEIEATGLGPDWTECNRWATALCKQQIAVIRSPTFHTVARESSPTKPVMTCQDYVENVLLALVDRDERIDVRFRTEVNELDQDAEAVTLRVRDLTTDSVTEVVADYVIGSDGPHSFARIAIGSELEAEPRPFFMQDVIFDADLSHYVGERKGGLLYTVTPKGVLIFQPLDGVRRWRCQIVRMEEAMLDQHETIELISLAAGAEAPLEIRIDSMGLWQPTPGCVDVMSSGRIFLAGDAAHVSVPTGGMGNNIGFAGARNLAWKLAHVLQGHAAPELLSSYEVEHRPFALERIDVGVKTTEYMGGIFQAFMAGEDVGPAAKRTQQYGDYDGVLLGFELQSNYIAPNTEPPPAVADATIDFVPSVRAGRRAPHVWIDHEAGRSVLDWFGMEYVVLLGSAVDARAWDQAVRANREGSGFPIRTEVLPERGIEPYRSEQIVLVRPDGIIADVWTECGLSDAARIERVARWLPLREKGG